MAQKVKLHQTWTLGEEIGRGGFGVVYKARSEVGEIAAIKLVQKAPGTEREMLFTDLAGVRNVVPIIDSGDNDTHWILVMPLAEKSLRQHLDKAVDLLSLADSIKILTDIAEALSDLDSKVGALHRDLKPGNVLLLDGRWCVADFGAARYAEAATATLTQMGVLTQQYAAPERWRFERATIATDVYALGVLAHELLTGKLPFRGPRQDDFRDQHLTATPPHLNSVPAGLAVLIEECLYKAPGARPAPPEIVARLSRVIKPASGGLAALQEAGRAEAIRQGELERRKSEEQLEAERHDRLFDAAKSTWSRISDAVVEALTNAAPAAQVTTNRDGGWRLRLNGADLTLFPPTRTKPTPWGAGAGPAFSVIAETAIGVRVPINRHGYEGRTHSLWYCDAHTADRYQWFETAFMNSPLIPQVASIEPFALEPGSAAAQALSHLIGKQQVAWPFRPLVPGDLEDFISDWAGWFAAGAAGGLAVPSTMPERRPEGSWRRS